MGTFPLRVSLAPFKVVLHPQGAFRLLQDSVRITRIQIIYFNKKIGCMWKMILCFFVNSTCIRNYLSNSLSSHKIQTVFFLVPTICEMLGLRIYGVHKSTNSLRQQARVKCRPMVYDSILTSNMINITDGTMPHAN